MSHESFEKQDRSWMDKLKRFREREVSGEDLEGFSDSVEKRIRESQAGRPMVGAFAPVFAAAIFAAVVFVFLWRQTPEVQVSPAADVSIEAMAPAELAEEIEMLQELEVWTEEDDGSMDITLEDSLGDLALFDIDIAGLGYSGVAT